MNNIPQKQIHQPIAETTPRSTDTSTKYSCINQIPKRTTQNQIHQLHHNRLTTKQQNQKQNRRVQETIQQKYQNQRRYIILKETSHQPRTENETT